MASRRSNAPGDESGRIDDLSSDSASTDDNFYQLRVRDNKHRPQRFRVNGYGEGGDQPIEGDRRDSGRDACKNRSKFLAGATENQVTRPLKAEIDNTFSNNIVAEAALRFLVEKGYQCNEVLISDIIYRLGDRIATAPFAERNSLKKLMPVLDKAFDVFKKVAPSPQPRHVSTCIRVLGRVHMFFDRLNPEDEIRKQGLDRARDLYKAFIPTWNKLVNSKAPNLTDCSEAIIGMQITRKLLLPFDGRSQDDYERIRSSLKSTCDFLVVKLQEEHAECLDRAEVMTFCNLMRQMVLEPITSKALVACLNEVLWQKDIRGQTAFDRCFLESSEKLFFKVRALFAASAYGHDNLQTLESIEGELALLLVTEKQISPEVLSEFLMAAHAHKYVPSQGFVGTLDSHLAKSLNGAWYDSGLLRQAAYYATQCLMIFSGSISDKTLQIAARNAKLATGAPASDLESWTARQLRTLQSKYAFDLDTNKSFGSVNLDFFLKPLDGSMPVNLEIDGFPYHAVYQIDTREFDESSPFTDCLRDRLLKERAGWKVVRVPGYDLKDEVGNLSPGKLEAIVAKLFPQRS